MLQRITTDGREVLGTARIGYTRSAWWLAVRVQAPAAERLQLIIGQTFLDDLVATPATARLRSHTEYIREAGSEGVELVMWFVMRGAMNNDVTTNYDHY